MGGGVIIRKQNRYMRRFAEAGAADPDHAVTLAELGCRDSWIFRRMVKKGVFVACGTDRYHLDERAAREFRQWRWTRIVIFVVAALIFWLFIQAIGH